MKFKEYLLVLILLLFISVLFVPVEKTGIAIGFVVFALVLLAIYFLIRKK